MNMLVTGGTGFIGSHFVAELKKRNNIVILMRDLSSALWTKWLNEALNGCTIVQGDLLNENVLRRTLAEYNINVAVHFAAQAIVSSALKDPLGTFQTNIIGTVNLLEACRQTDIEQIYIQSTDKVYGERMNAKEEDPVVSTGIYETSKSCQDLATQAFAETYGLNIIIGRACNTYGYDLAKRIIPNTIKSCLIGEPPIIFQGEHTLRQYIYVEDLVDAIGRLTTKKANGIYNIATDDILTQEQVVRKICNFFLLTPKLVKRDKPLKEIQKQSVNWDKLKALDWQPKRSFEEAVKITIERYEKYGGNNVKERNPMYAELHAWAKKNGLDDWPTLRSYLRNTNNINPELVEIILTHRSDSGWDWENESRDFFLWLKAIRPADFKGYESESKPPSVGSPPEVMAYVEEQYLAVLGRNADDGGKKACTDAIIRGAIKREELPGLLKNSEEYKQKHPATEHKGSEGR